jgi:uroporphyrin-III C-methyltransferase / precorrin-2 dehydrogenase / sirohydrochlorin ferrochelatase
VTGLVSLVGAGPGDPDLLTRRALDRLARADLVLNDALVPAELLEFAPTARRFFVGKRAGRHSIEQTTIHALMIRAARRGHRVVRLKCGDPFVLGRGGEEALALAAAGIDFEIVPGVSSALAAPALAGIPVTHRGLATAVVVMSGHAPSAWRPIVDSLAPGAATIVVLMGLGTRGQLAPALLDRGWPGITPCAVVLSASHASQASWRGPLTELPTATFADLEAPGVIVIGAVVDLAATVGAAMIDSHRHSPGVAAHATARRRSSHL